MRSIMRLVMVGGIVVGLTGESRAQFSPAIGNPYLGSGLGMGTPAGFNYGYPNYSSYGLRGPGYYGGYNNFYNSGFVAGPGTFSYRSGYTGYAAPVVPVVPLGGYGSGVRPYSFGGYGYGSYGYGVRNGFAPFRGIGQRFR